MQFDAFDSGNYPALARAGVKIDYNFAAIRTLSKPVNLNLRATFEPNIAILKLFPGITRNVVSAVINAQGLKAVILETYGSGNAPTLPWLIEELAEAIEKGIIIVNVSQCQGGRVVQGRYETSKKLQQIGVISGADMTTEAAVTKLMILIGEYGVSNAKTMIGISMAGELSA